MELTLFVDHQCNLRCTYCYGGAKVSRPMSLATMRKAVALAVAERPARLDVSFFGGEPLLRPAFLREAIEHVERTLDAMAPPRPRLLFVVNTNATRVDDAIVETLSPPRPVSVFASLDGPRDVHDLHRVAASGVGSFDDALAGIARLQAARVPVHLVAVIRPEAARRLGDVVRTAVSLRPPRLVLQPDLRADWTEEAIDDLRAGLRDAGRAWADDFRSGGALALEPMLTKILAHTRGGVPCPRRCSFGGDLAVAPSGRIYPCAQMIGEDTSDELVIGDVDLGLDSQRASGLRRAKDAVEQVCAPCAIRDRCESHCGCRQLGASGRLGQVTAAFCEIERAMVEAADEVAEALWAERCEAFVDFVYRRAWVESEGAQLTTLRTGRS